MSETTRNYDLKEIKDWLLAKASQELGVTKDQVDCDATLLDLGFTSQSTVNLVKGLDNEFNAKLKPIILYKYPTINLLAEYLSTVLVKGDSNEQQSKSNEEMKKSEEVLTQQIKVKPEARFRLFCLPGGGGTALNYYLWTLNVPDWIDLIPVELPGRGQRANEKLLYNMDESVNQMFTELKPFLDKPFAFLCMSLNSMFAFALAEKAQAENFNQMKVFFLVAPWAPPSFCLDFAPLISQYNDPNKLFSNSSEELRKYNIDPAATAADWSVCWTYHRTIKEKLSCPISLIYSDADSLFELCDLDGWAKETQFSTQFFKLSGNHFFAALDPKPILANIVETIDNIMNKNQLNGALDG